jgi:glycosyltransferase involved in cell wall biosynthesis
MKILLVGNYEPGNQKSMQRFASMLDRGFRAAGHETRLIRPPVIAGRLAARGLVAKWLRYADEFLVFPKLLKRAATWADVVHVCDHANAVYIKYLLHRPHIVTCHDMLAVRSALGEIPCNPTSWTGRQLQGMILRGLQAAGRTGHIACVSEATRVDILRVAGVPRESVSQIYNGLNFPFSPLDPAQGRAVIEKFGIRKDQRFLLHVGGNKWYKNRLGVLKLFSALKSRREAKNVSLVMAGQPFTSEMLLFLRTNFGAGEVLQVENPTNEELMALYSCADLMLFPSLEEGFGWPIIEAQACGCPVVTSDRAPMTEVGGDAATYIDPNDFNSAVSAIAQRVRIRNQPCEKSLINVERFNPSQMIGRYLALHEMLLRSRDANGHRQGTVEKGRVSAANSDAHAGGMVTARVSAARILNKVSNIQSNNG